MAILEHNNYSGGSDASGASLADAAKKIPGKLHAHRNCPGSSYHSNGGTPASVTLWGEHPVFSNSPKQ